MFKLIYSYANFEDKDYGAAASFFKTKKEAIEESEALLEIDLKNAIFRNFEEGLTIEDFSNEIFDKETGNWEIEYYHSFNCSKVEIIETKELE